MANLQQGIFVTDGMQHCCRAAAYFLRVLLPQSARQSAGIHRGAACQENGCTLRANTHQDRLIPHRVCLCRRVSWARHLSILVGEFEDRCTSIPHPQTVQPVYSDPCLADLPAQACLRWMARKAWHCTLPLYVIHQLARSADRI